MAVPSSKIAENVMSPGAARAPLLAMSIVLASLLWIGGVVGRVGSYLGTPEREAVQFCEGKCICDGGTLDAALMRRVCPAGWEKAFARSVHKLRKKRSRLRRERLRKMHESQAEPPPSALVPSV
ncbi:MAG: hypothetical protein GY811_28150 [Myxococcales bacterium]|nr:hypothetical protein [Myxococcales bacterium]